MTTWMIDRNDSADVAAFGRQLERVAAQPGVAGLLVLACDANNFTPAQIDPLLQRMELPLFGGIFPALIAGGEKLDVGAMVVGLPVAPRLLTVPELGITPAACETFLEEHATVLDGARTLFVWVDGLSSGIGCLLEGLYHVFGLEQNYIGGGAGSLSFEKKPCLFTNQGLLGNAAVLAALDVASGVGVSHGWQTISGPYKVTGAQGNVIQSLNWRPAFEIYREVVEAASGRRFTDDNFFDLAKQYPFGIVRLDSEPIVRDPIIAQADGALVCVGAVPDDSHVNILSGSTASLVQAAGQALQLSEAGLPPGDTAGLALFVDCISRVLFLEDEFSQELAAVQRPARPTVGALTLGEIANAGRDYLEFYNKTAVMGLLADP